MARLSSLRVLSLTANTVAEVAGTFPVPSATWEYPASFRGCVPSNVPSTLINGPPLNHRL